MARAVEVDLVRVVVSLAVADLVVVVSLAAAGLVVVSLAVDLVRAAVDLVRAAVDLVKVVAGRAVAVKWGN